MQIADWLIDMAVLLALAAAFGVYAWLCLPS
jgi:hypothetical protein